MQDPQSTVISEAVVKHIAKLANLEISADQVSAFAGQLSSVIGYISKIQALDTKNIPETNQVTGLKNIVREDIVDKSKMFSQKEALANAKKTYKGYFVVKYIF